MVNRVLTYLKNAKDPTKAKAIIRKSDDVSSRVAEAAIAMYEGKDLRSLSQRLELAATSAEHERHAQHTQLKQVLCQQTEQELLLQELRADVKRLQHQVQLLEHPLQADTGEAMSVVEILESGVKSLDKLKEGLLIAAEADRSCNNLVESLEHLEQHKMEMKGWFAELCAQAMKDIVGPEIQRNANAIKSLDGRVDELCDVAKQAEAVKNLNSQVEELNEATKRGLSSLQRILVAAGLRPNTPESAQVSNAEQKLEMYGYEDVQKSNVEKQMNRRKAAPTSSKLRSIVEDTCEAHDKDIAENIPGGNVSHDISKQRLTLQYKGGTLPVSSKETHLSGDQGEIAGA